MLNIGDTLYFSSVHGHVKTYKGFWEDLIKDLPFAGQWYIKISERVHPLRHISRDGVWTTPWPQELIPKFVMPKYDPTYSKTFSEVTDENAQRIKHRVQTGEKFGVMWSGGIDSTVIVAALIKNLSKKELENIYILCSGESMIESPRFYGNFIHNKIKTLDSRTHKYDTLINMDITPITGDEGDCVFGTQIGLNMYNNFDALIEKSSPQVRENLKPLRTQLINAEAHYSVFKDLLIQYFNLPWHPEFGRLLYEKYDYNIKTASVPVYSLHDFFWWLIFNVKYLNCSARGSIYYNDTLHWHDVMTRMVNWYNDTDYQLWSMANNNNGTKIKNHILSYKSASKDYIYDLDKDIWYYTFKSKVDSLWNITWKNNQDIPGSRPHPDKIAVKKDNLELVHFSDPGVTEYFTHYLTNYKIDWTDI